MKKIAILVTALLLCCGCNEKNREENIEEEVPETAVSSEIADIPAAAEANEEDNEISAVGGETAAEQGLRSYDASEFKEIKVSISLTEKDAPVKLTSFKLPEHDFGERIAPCKTSDDPLQYDPYKDFPESADSENESICKKMLDSPEKGYVTEAVIDGNKIYMIVDYDINCSQCHEWVLACYDIETKEMKEIYNYSGIEDVSGKPVKLVLAGNKMLFNSIDTVQQRGAVKAVDLEKGTCETVYDIQAATSIIKSGDKKVKLLFVEDTGDHVVYEITVKEYDTETGELTTIAESEETKVYSIAPGEYFAYLRMPCESKTCEVVSDDYQLDLGIKAEKLLYASKDKIIALSDDLNLHTFDLAKKEHYITPIGKYSGTSIACNDNVVLVSIYMDKMCYFMPELGLAFDLSDQLYDIMMSCSDSETAAFDYLYRSGDTVAFNLGDRISVTLEDNGYYYVVGPKIINRIETVE